MVAAIKERRAFAGGLLPSLRGATGPLIGLIVLCLFLTFATDKFMSVRNFLNVLDQITVLGVMAVGMTLVILIGGIDLAVGSVMALAMMVLGYLNVVLGVPMPLAISLALCAASLNGLIAGLLITRFNVPPFIATLAMMSIARGIANMITDGQQIIGFPAWFNMMAIVRFGGFVTLTVAVMVVVFIIGLLYQRYRHGGRGTLCHRRKPGSGTPCRHQCPARHRSRLCGVQLARRPCRHGAGGPARFRPAVFGRVL